MHRVVADFTADATGGKTFQLKKLRGQSVVVYFYAQDSTPGCTQEGLDFRELHGRKFLGVRTQHIPDRCRRQTAPRVAQSQSERPCG